MVAKVNYFTYFYGMPTPASHSASSPPDTAPIVAQIRAFNRFYINLIGLLDKQVLTSTYSLAEARLLYEIHAGQPLSASHLLTTLHLDKGYLSRVLKKLAADKLLHKQRSAHDARTTLLSLTPAGHAVFQALTRTSNEQLSALLRPLSPTQHQELVQHMHAITALLRPTPCPPL